MISYSRIIRKERGIEREMERERGLGVGGRRDTEIGMEWVVMGR